jgi:diadenylate cyclase
MESLEGLFASIAFRLSNLSWLDWLDLLLVILVFIVLINLIQRSRFALLLRGVLLIILLLIVTSFFLPLRTFGWIIRVTLFAFLLSLPVIFHTELRRLLERLGRTIGLMRAARQAATETVLRGLIRAVEQLSETRTGALIVIEGDVALTEVIETGVPVGGQLTRELILAIFRPGNPLHDGAAIVRGDRIVAASAVLPLTNRELAGTRRLGTRHRAAVGMSEESDAFIIVVSEETGRISLAHLGEFIQGVDSATLRDHIVRFSKEPTNPQPDSLSLGALWGQLREGWGIPEFPQTRREMLGNVVVGILLALSVWWFVLETTDPLPQVRVDGIPLDVPTVVNGVVVSSPLPDTVAAVVQTTEGREETISANTLRATLSLEGLEAGSYELPLEVENRTGIPIRVLTIEPAIVEVALQPVVSRQLPITVSVEGVDQLPPAYEIAGEPVTTPATVEATGPLSLIDVIGSIEATVSVADATGTVNAVQRLRVLDREGLEMENVEVSPSEVRISVPIERRLNARDVGVQVMTTGEPPAGYWLSGITVSPSTVTLTGDPIALDAVGGVVETRTVDVSQARGELSIDVPLDIPQGITALDGEGNPVGSVSARIQVSPQAGNIILTRPVEVVGEADGGGLVITPESVELHLSGPLPILNSIEEEPGLVRVLLDPSELEPGAAVETVPQVVMPSGLEAQLVPPLLTVSRVAP